MYGLLVPWCKLPEHADQTDAERMADLQAKTLTRVNAGTMINRRTIAVAFPNPLDGERFNRKLDAVALWPVPAGNTDADVLTSLVIRTCKGWMDPAAGGIDAGDAGVRSLVSLLPSLTPAGITEDEVNALKALAETKISQCEAWGFDVGPGHLSSAREIIANEGN